MTSAVKCRRCDAVVVRDERNIVGCNCDPDSPTWVYIQPDGRVRGFSQAAWDVVRQAAWDVVT